MVKGGKSKRIKAWIRERVKKKQRKRLGKERKGSKVMEEKIKKGNCRGRKKKEGKTEGEKMKIGRNFRRKSLEREKIQVK